MKSTLIAIALAAALAGAAVPVFARDRLQQEASQVISLKDGSTPYLFKDGKTARENKFDYPWLFKAGEVLETTDGRKMTPVGNEVAQLGGLLNDGHRNRWTRPSAGLPHLV